MDVDAQAPAGTEGASADLAAAVVAVQDSGSNPLAEAWREDFDPRALAAAVAAALGEEVVAPFRPAA